MKPLIEEFDIVADDVPDPEIERFRDDVAGSGQLTDARAILKDEIPRQQKVFPQHAKNAALVLEGRVGSLRSMTGAEKQIFAFYLRHNLGCHILEFEAFLLEREAKQKVVFVTTFDLGVVTPTEALAKLRANLDLGFSLKAHVHNHPFYPRGLPGGGGGGMLFPSGDQTLGDLYVYSELRRNYGPTRAVIMNGFEAFDMSLDEWYKFFAE